MRQLLSVIVLLLSWQWFVRGAKSYNIMPKRVNKIPSAGHKKRKEVSISANNESGPSKKKYRYVCHVDGCGNKRVEGGVCIRQGQRSNYAALMDAQNMLKTEECVSGMGQE